MRSPAETPPTSAQERRQIIGMDQLGQELPIGRGVPGIIAPALVHVFGGPVGPEHVDDLGHDVGELPELLVALAERILGVFQIRDIDGHPADQGDGTVGILDGELADDREMHEPVLMFQGLDRADPGRVGQGLPIVLTELGGCLRREDLLIGPAIEVFAPGAKCRLGRVVGVEITTLEVLDPGESRQVLHEPPEPVLALAHGLLGFAAATGRTELDPHPGHQLAWEERPDQEVVGPRVQAVQSVPFRVPIDQHDHGDRRGVGVRSQLAQPALAPIRDTTGDDKVRQSLVNGPQRRVAVGYELDRIAFREHPAGRLPQLAILIGQQDPWPVLNGSNVSVSRETVQGGHGFLLHQRRLLDEVRLANRRQASFNALSLIIPATAGNRSIIRQRHSRGLSCRSGRLMVEPVLSHRGQALRTGALSQPDQE